MRENRSLSRRLLTISVNGALWHACGPTAAPSRPSGPAARPAFRWARVCRAASPCPWQAWPARNRQRPSTPRAPRNGIPDIDNDFDHRADPLTRQVVRPSSRDIKAKIRHGLRNRREMRRPGYGFRSDLVVAERTVSSSGCYQDHARGSRLNLPLSRFSDSGSVQGAAAMAAVIDVSQLETMTVRRRRTRHRGAGHLPPIRGPVGPHARSRRASRSSGRTPPMASRAQPARSA